MSMRPNTSPPGTKGYGPESPVQQALTWTERFFAQYPRPDLDSDRAQADGALIGVHLLHLLRGCGLLNGTGFHSAAVSLLRSLEDALDCFAAVTLVRGAAEEWETGLMKPSDAAKKWTSFVDDMTPIGMPLPEYRKYLRRDFNTYSHCSCALCEWNLFFNPRARNERTRKLQGTLELNVSGRIIDSNAHAVDAFETAHILEFLAIIRRAYSKLFATKDVFFLSLDTIEPGVDEIMQKHNEHKCQEVRRPPEIARLDKR